VAELAWSGAEAVRNGVEVVKMGGGDKRGCRKTAREGSGGGIYRRRDMVGGYVLWVYGI
jgi:hypothetical protein